MSKRISLIIISMLMIGILLVAMPTKVFATEGDGLIDLEELTGSTPTQTPTEEQPKEEQEQKPAEEQKKEELPKAGLAEDTIMVVSIMALGTTAVYAYKKINEYQNI